MIDIEGMAMCSIDTKIDWVDKEGEVIKVLHVDTNKGEVRFKWLHNPNRTSERVISIDKFLRYAVPVDQAQVAVNETVVKKGTPSHIWFNELPNKFGKSPNLQLADQEWLEHGMHAKTVKFNIGQGGLPAEVNWEDKCAAIASIDNAPAKSLASIILWGSDTAWDWSRYFDDVVSYLTTNMIERCMRDGRSEPKACAHNLTELARLMARMTLHFELYQLWDVYTVKGRLAFSGIEVNDRTYSNHFLCYQKQMLSDLDELVSTANININKYRACLNYDS